jgi:hypothetical protein
MFSRDIIHPRERFSCITPALGFKVAKFELADSNVRKRPSPLGLPYKWHRWPQDSINVLTYPPQAAGLVGCKCRYFSRYNQRKRGKISNNRQKKVNNSNYYLRYGSLGGYLLNIKQASEPSLVLMVRTPMKQITVEAVYLA